MSIDIVKTEKPARGPRTIWHLSALAVGDHQFVGRDETGHDSCRVYAMRRGKQLGFKFSCRKVEGGINVVRVE